MRTQMKNPDFIIQAEHVGSGAFSKIAKSMGAQYRLLPTDYQIDHFIQGLDEGSDDPDILGQRIDIGIDDSAINDTLAKKKLRNHLVVGYPVRWEILNFAESLRSDEVAVREEAVEKVNAFFKKYDFKENDRSIFVMLGGKGASKETTQNYIKNIAKMAPDLRREADGKIHLFVAQAYEVDPETKLPLRESELEMAAFETKLRQELAEEFKSKKFADSDFKLHLKGWVTPEEVGMFMHKGVTITKAGGGTLAELATIGGQGIFDMKLSNYVDWEKWGAGFFEKKEWGSKLENSNNVDDLKNRLKESFATLEKGITDRPKNQFHLDWPYLILKDAQKILNSRLKIPTPNTEIPKSSIKRIPFKP